MNRICVFLVLLAALVSIHAQSPDEQYVRIYQVIQEADRLNDAGQGRVAAAKYVEAQEALTRFRGVYQGWNERVINYRLNYVATKLAPLSASLATTGPTVPSPGSSAPGFSINTNATSFQPTNTPVIPPPNTALPMSAELDIQIRDLQAEVGRLQADNQRLSAKLKEALSVQPAAMDPRELVKAEDRIRALLKENELFKAQLAAQRPNTPAPASSLNLNARITEQSEAVAALRAENEILKKQSAEWRGKYDALASVDAARVPPAEVQATVRKLTTENMGLTKQVELWKQIAQSNQRQTALARIPAMPPEAQRELLALRARVQTLEASPVPYTPEELALFNTPSPALAANVGATVTPRTASPPPSEGPAVNVTRGVPTGAGPLVRAAERAFATGRYEESEQRYLEVVQQEPHNVTMLCNLASAQLEQGRIQDAEKNVVRARELDSEDYFAWYLLGRIRFRQEKLDEALESLSRSVKANPDYPEAQNYLGIVLSEKGLRGPAEAALRKAVQLQPNNAVAHNNLAIVYATQKPAALALARWHYKKARDAGHPPNAELEKLLQ
ncbi:MAG TPA: tetratricopeptide repeat protein [Methylomirabilota bacterium]|nr:tetratricopeptide repeat protein [Methylomirabilota bacterium]